MKLLLAILLSTLMACGLTTTRPKKEMSLAAAAFLAAKRADAATLSPALYKQAETYYLKAKSSYKKKYFNKAKQYAQLSRKYAERAEFLSVKKKSLDGVQTESY